jgi:hypothetical protein
MSGKAIELMEAETRRLEALGVVLGLTVGLKCLAQAMPRRHGGRRQNAGRKKIYSSEAAKKREYRKRKRKRLQNVTVSTFSSEIH